MKWWCNFTQYNPTVGEGTAGEMSVADSKQVPLKVEIDGKITTRQTITDKFNNYYVSVANNIINSNSINNISDDRNKINPLNYLYYAFK